MNKEVSSNNESIPSTLDILMAKGMTKDEALEFIEGIRQGIKELKEGKVRPWPEIKREVIDGKDSQQ